MGRRVPQEHRRLTLRLVQLERDNARKAAALAKLQARSAPAAPLPPPPAPPGACLDATPMPSPWRGLVCVQLLGAPSAELYLC